MVALLSWFDRCNNQDHLQLPELRQPQFHNIGVLRWSPISLVSSLLSSYDCSQPASHQLLLSLGSLYSLWFFHYFLWFFCNLLCWLRPARRLCGFTLWFFCYLILFCHFISIFCLYNTLDCSVLTASMSPIPKQKPTLPIPIKDPITLDLLGCFLVSSIFIVSHFTCSFSIFITLR